MPGRNLFAAEAQPKGRNLFASTSGEFVGPPVLPRDEPPPTGFFARANAGMKRLGQVGLGTAEAAAQIGTNMVASPINEFAAGVADMRDGGKTGDEVLANPPVPSYQPKSPVGQAISGGIATALSPVAKAVDYFADTENQNPAVRATGHLMKGVAGLLPMKLPLGKVGRAAEGAAPTLAQLEASAKAAYKVADETSGIVPQSKLGELVPKVEERLAEAGADPDIHPMAFKVLNKITDEATKPGVAGHSLKGLETTRKTLLAAESKALGTAGGADDARLAGQMIDDFDEFTENLKNEDLVGGKGNVEEGVQAYNSGREQWARLKKAQTIESLIERAKNATDTYPSAGYENALRLQFKRLADNPRRFRAFSPEEQAAILKVVRPGVGQRVARQLGRFAPRGPVSAGTDLLVGATAGGGAGAALAGIGEAGKLASSIMRLNAVEKVSDLVRRGKQPATVPQKLGRFKLAEIAAHGAPGIAIASEDRQ